MSSITFKDVLSISVVITTPLCFFFGIPICREIYRRGSTDHISSFPFIAGLVNVCLWLRYGILKHEWPIIIANIIGSTLYSGYLLFYLNFSNRKSPILIKIAIAILIILSILVGVHIFINTEPDWTAQALGFVAMASQVVLYGAPLAAIVYVIKQRCTDTLPLPMICALTFISVEWLIYGLILNDIYIVITNILGIALLVIQLSLFIVFPMIKGGVSPLGRVCPSIVRQNEGARGREMIPVTVTITAARAVNE